MNEFWFDYAKSANISIKRFRGIFGDFFEDYTIRALINLYPQLRNGKELMKEFGLGEEPCDFIYNEENKILLGEIKSTWLAAEQLEGKADSLFRGDEEKFFQDTGLSQIVSDLHHMRDNPEHFLPGVKWDKLYDIYPVIVFNEKVFSTEFMPQLFQEALENRIERKKFPFMNIHPITLMHISDIENIHDMIRNKKFDIWNLLQRNFVGSRFPLPFRLTINRTSFGISIPPADFYKFAY
jgi:hypothetical protein